MAMAAGVYKKGKNYFIDYYFQGRRLREKVGPSHRMAQLALAARLGEIAQGRFELKRSKTSPLFDDFARQYLQWAEGYKRSWTRDRISIRAFSREYGNHRLSQITPWLIERFKRTRKDQVSVASVNRDLAVLKHMFSMAIRWGLATENPVKLVKFFKLNNQRIRFLSLEEEDKLLAACDPELRRIVIAALHTGMRRGELFALQWNHVDFTNRLVTVADSKNREPRRIPMSSTLTALLEEIRINAPASLFVFHGKKDQPYRCIRSQWERAAKKAGIRDFRFHDLRHTFASRLVMAGVDLVTVKELLGHKSIEMTMRYSHLSQDHKRRAISLLDGHHLDTKGISKGKPDPVSRCQ